MTAVLPPRQTPTSTMAPPVFAACAVSVHNSHRRYTSTRVWPRTFS
ncbi:MAG: hypothetical protein IPF99_00010 [Deltaproteobacteria bacterium]|nr:hypothetical protein [Deltaproteobacteria bacterium]